MVFQKKSGAATKRSFSEMNEKVPKKVLEVEEEEDEDDTEDDSDISVDEDISYEEYKDDEDADDVVSDEEDDDDVSDEEDDDDVSDEDVSYEGDASDEDVSCEGGASDEEDDSEDEDEQDAIKKKIASLKKEVLPKKEKKAQNELNATSSEPKNKKGKTLLKNQETVDAKGESEANSPAQNRAFQASLEADLQRKRERDARNLFVRGLPPDVTIEEIKAMSPDILDVSLPKSRMQKKNRKSLFGFLEFPSEKKAEENYVKLQKKKLRGQELFIDYTGEKSKNKTVAIPVLNHKNINKRKLVVSALPVDVTVAEVAQLFPQSYSITLNNAPECRNCSVLFHTDEDAAEAFKANESSKIRRRAISVLYATEKGTAAKQRGFKRPFQGKQNFQSNKKMRM